MSVIYRPTTRWGACLITEYHILYKVLERAFSNLNFSAYLTSIEGGSHCFLILPMSSFYNCEIIYLELNRNVSFICKKLVTVGGL